MKIAIDPGHNCQPDIGAEFTNSTVKLREDEIALGVARELRVIAEKDGIEVVWCLPSSAVSVGDSLRKRCETANRQDSDLYIAIHCNAATETVEPRGSEVYAVSPAGKTIAAKILDKLAGLGWKNRGIKTDLDCGKPPYVLTNTNATAVLIELCFLDSAADRLVLARNSPKQIASAIYEAICPKNPTFTVEQSIVKNPGSTDAVKALSDRVIDATGLDQLVKLSAPNFKSSTTCDPYFQVGAAKSLRNILAANPTLTLECNSAYRSVVRQFVLRENFDRRIGNITAAAQVGSGDHESGLAIDVNNWTAWKNILIRAGWQWQGDNDPVHFFYPNGDRSLPEKSIAAFQALHNKYGGSGGKLDVDGEFGARTRLALLSAPAGGWG